MNNKKIALDIDGVLANFYLSVCKKYKKPYKIVTKYGVPWIDKKMKFLSYDEEFWENLEILNPPESIDFDFDIYLTSMPTRMFNIRKKWLKKNGYPDKPLIIAHNKLQVCKDYKINIIIDDKPQTIINCKKEGIKTIQFIPHYVSWKTYGDYNVRHFNQISKILKTI